jgi:N utilization substance protein B
VGIVSRRYLRVKVLQALYASPAPDPAEGAILEKEMFKSIGKLHELFVLMLHLLLEIRNSADDLLEARRSKVRPTAEEISPNRHFVDNKALVKLAENTLLERAAKKYKTDWSLHSDIVRRLYRKLETTPEYLRYIALEEDTFKADRAFVSWLYETLIIDNESFDDIAEEANIYWSIDLELIHISVLKAIHRLKEHQSSIEPIIPPIYPDEEGDIDFARTLLRKTMQHNSEYEKIIAERADNWDAERIANLDIVLMKMALTELEFCPTIPVKVTLNEYIDLARKFSTGKSRGFINGILDKIVVQWRSEGRIKKEGRGLVEE